MRFIEGYEELISPLNVSHLVDQILAFLFASIGILYLLCYETLQGFHAGLHFLHFLCFFSKRAKNHWQNNP
jgi:hypothetical protein